MNPADLASRGLLESNSKYPIYGLGVYGVGICVQMTQMNSSKY